MWRLRQLKNWLDGQGVLAPFRPLWLPYTSAGRKWLSIVEPRRTEAVRFYRAIIYPQALVFDVGANVGWRTDCLLTAGARRVVAIEPGYAPRQTLRSLYRFNPRVSLIPKGLATREGEATFYVSDSNEQVSSLDGEWTQKLAQHEGVAVKQIAPQITTTTIQLTTLDRLIERFGLPAFVKIDVEGYEAEVLAGCSRALPLFSFEYTSSLVASGLACLDHMERFGEYKYNVCDSEEWQFLFPQWLSSTQLRQFLAEKYEAFAQGQHWVFEIYARLLTDASRSNVR